MADLHEVSSMFERTPMWDAYTGRKLAVKCQITPWDTPRRDGMTTIRRTFFVKPNSKFPRRKAVIVANQVWLIARLSNPDTWGRNISREGYVAQYANLGLLADTEDVLSGNGYPVYVSRVWVKDVKDITSTSESQGQYYIYYTSEEPVYEGAFVFSDGRWHVVRNIISGTAGLMVAECNELEPDCVVDVETTQSGEYDPVLETYTDATRSVFKAVMLAWKDDYNHSMPSREAEEIGDKRLRVQSSDSSLITQDAVLSIKGFTWKVVEYQPKLDGSVSVVIRRV